MNTLPAQGRGWSLGHELRLALVAWQFLTRVPLPSQCAERLGYRDEWLHQSARHFPLVGMLVGGLACAVYLLANLVFTPLLAVGLSMACSLLVTGGFHEDGWADTCDGLGGSASRERALEIMKDSRIGAYGAIGLVMMLGLKAAALAAMPAAVAVGSMLLAHAVSRAVAVSLLRVLPYAGDVAHAKAKPMAQQLSGPGGVVAWCWAMIAALAALAGGLSIAMAGVALLAALVMGIHCARWFRARLGGYTGDCLGAAQQLAELAAYLGVVAAWRWM
jgi:adenosylcobinamide-GDP ribazoletransferase